MKNMSGIDGSQRPLPAVRADAAGTRATRPRPRPADEDFSRAAASPPSPVIDEPAPENKRLVERYEAATAELQQALDAAPGPERDVELRFEDDGQFVVEIRRRDDGVVIQRFPPENLLNLAPSAADLLGTVVDRRS